MFKEISEAYEVLSDGTTIYILLLIFFLYDAMLIWELIYFKLQH